MTSSTKALSDDERASLLDDLVGLQSDADQHGPKHLLERFLPLPAHDRALSREVMVVRGERGAGKSMLFKTLAALRRQGLSVAELFPRAEQNRGRVDRGLQRERHRASHCRPRRALRRRSHAGASPRHVDGSPRLRHRQPRPTARRVPRGARRRERHRAVGHRRRSIATGAHDSARRRARARRREQARRRVALRPPRQDRRDLPRDPREGRQRRASSRSGSRCRIATATSAQRSSCAKISSTRASAARPTRASCARAP
jgi:hypothetical protein